ncbi:MAG: DNA polymerase IV, partial [Dehalococcoidia bacterium]|nr:DNA polymerase IV [Dehalococcoidia bacterium]
GKPMAVGGSVEDRHGIILAKNYEAKAYGIKTAETIWEAKKKCPQLIVVPPDFDKYLRFSKLFRQILLDYSDQVEPFGIDEAWLDVSGSTQLFGSGEQIADTIRNRVKSELGITVSVGVSFNKIFAKLGSDMKKPDAVTVINKENYQTLAWPLPVGDLLGVGRATQNRLRYQIRTIGELAQANPQHLKWLFGKRGLILHSFANGWDTSTVKPAGFESCVKSVGNSSTCPRDLADEQDVRIVFQSLAESVAERMRDLAVMARTVQISLRTNDLYWFERQTALARPSMVSDELTAAAMKLLREHYHWEKPLRSIGIRGTNLISTKGARQLSLFADEQGREQSERVEYAIDDIRRRFGHHAINRALLVVDRKLGKLDAKSNHTIHPVSFS